MLENPIKDSYPKSESSSMAVASLVSSILGLTLLPVLGSIIALIAGYMARNEIRNSQGTLGGENLATVGLILGWIGVGLFVLGCLLGGVIFFVTWCLLILGISIYESSIILPVIFSFI